MDAQKSVRLKADLTKFAVSQDYYNKASSTVKASLTTSENGVFTFYNETTGKIYYYYRGAVDNNYLKFGKYKSGDKSGQDIYWRIIWMNDKNEMKIVLDENVPLKIYNTQNQAIDLTTKPEIYSMLKPSPQGYTYYFINPVQINYEVSGYDRIYTWQIDSTKYISADTWKSLNNITDSKGVYTDKTYYVSENSKWFNTTDLSSYNTILSKLNYCSNPCKKDSYGIYNYYPSNNFECLSGSKDSTKGCTYQSYTTTSN